MSEYQYYEFVAVDRPLTAAQQGELRAMSTRARISSSSFVNHYEWGDLKGDPRVLMEHYFDAHLYLANWGTHRIMLRWPRNVLDPGMAAMYCGGESAHSWSTRGHVILGLSSEDEGDEEWWNEEDRLASIVGVRSELAAGDMRLLYLAWLLCVQNRELDDDEPEPPVPPGLGELSGPLRALAEFLRLDQDLLAVAAQVSPSRKAKPASAAALTKWVKALPAADKDAVLVRLLRGDDPHLRAELLRRYDGRSAAEPAAGCRTAGELLAGAEAGWARRQRLAEERAAAERARREQAAAAAREQRLNALATEQDQAWQRVAAMIKTKRPTEYDAAVDLLTDLAALARRDRQTTAFSDRIRRLREEHARKPSLLDRLDRARLD